MSTLGDVWNSITEFAGDTVASGLEAVLNATIYRLLYYIEYGLCWIVGMLDQMFQVFAGIVKVSYDGEPDYLINVFFRNHAVSNVYWGMALIGVALCFGFAIFAAVRKLFDGSGKIQQSWGQMMAGLLRSIVLILGMSAIMAIVLNSTNILMQQVNYLFNDAENKDLPETIVYTDEQYAAMGRVLNTIGNYALNPSYNSRYNINACFNEIRQDLYYLQQQGVFRYYYTRTDQNGKTINTWQNVLQDVANAADLRYDLKLDKPYESVTRSLTRAMDVIGEDASFKPLGEYTRVTTSETLVPLDRLVFLMGSMHAAKNPMYNAKPALDDSLRAPYYTGEKSIYDLDQVNKDFDIGIASTDYIIVYVACVALIFDLMVIILNCIARIFNMLFLYLIAPPVIAAQTLDSGGKTRQWMIAFLVQSLSVFGTVISMRLLLIYLPIIAGPRLVLFENSVILNLMAKLVLIYGGFEAAKKSTALLTGILADSAGWQSIQAGDMSTSAAKAIGSVTGVAKGVAGTGLKTAGTVVGFAAKPLTNLAKRPFAAIGSAWSNLGTGREKAENERSIEKEISLSKAKQQYANEHPEDAKYLSGVTQPKTVAPSRPARDIEGPRIAPPDPPQIAPGRPARDIDGPQIAPPNAPQIAPDRPARDIDGPQIAPPKAPQIAPGKPARDIDGPRPAPPKAPQQNRQPPAAPPQRQNNPARPQQRANQQQNNGPQRMNQQPPAAPPPPQVPPPPPVPQGRQQNVPRFGGPVHGDAPRMADEIAEAARQRQQGHGAQGQQLPQQQAPVGQAVPPPPQQNIGQNDLPNNLNHQ